MLKELPKFKKSNTDKAEPILEYDLSDIDEPNWILRITDMPVPKLLSLESSSPNTLKAEPSRVNERTLMELASWQNFRTDMCPAVRTYDLIDKEEAISVWCKIESL
jgi:hypothetical protein